jgi:hypothetical protein
MYVLLLIQMGRATGAPLHIIKFTAPYLLGLHHYILVSDVISHKLHLRGTEADSRNPLSII